MALLSKYMIKKYAEHGFKVYPDGRISLRDAAKYLGVSYQHLYNNVYNDNTDFDFKHIRIGRKIYYNIKDLEQYASKYS